ncbi:hypothetical protein EMIHUDRAFT_464264 [Emiliania huxleyi CCMP1516]|uniref:TRUD domain-containing protein n=2 Tax=Emiliania huxleyi TaxID=2903 RepID=A0A0D3IZV9_EMIH1|nr:hypothetical protein EMIHUDRAFT_464264 [Emiliania huxleyi CCMP1516]EOD16794.1 hypothetical protein EMIHUDRAFT_464264 [Emiliania huxleyi CCMP1516]|eukprot:XP_005769223.1 hypothetical protein EMIHUDRAFT_464264 [Emiliania huxleyi CCMP1516]
MRKDRSSRDVERDVGIFDYATPDVAGFGGALKVTPADFQVNELRASGEEVSLDSSPLPEDAGSEGSNVRFVLQKERLDTLGALAELGSLLGVPTRSFSVAGLKDYRAVTTQEVVARDVTPEAVAACAPPPCLRLGRAWPTATKLRLGGCGGNRFRIVVRGVAGGGRRIDKALRALKRRGFINYFGLQRFGSGASVNHEVGLACLLRRYDDAVCKALSPPAGGRTSSAELEAHEAWAVGRDARSALRLMPRSRHLQRALLARLAGEATDGGGAGAGRARQPNGWSDLTSDACRDAVLSLPLPHRRLLAHAYFSRLWNIAASERLRRYGVGPAREGELVWLRPADLPPGCECDGCAQAAAGGGGPHAYERGRRRRRSVHIVSAAEAAAEVFAAKQVVLPLAGSRTLFPRDEVGSLLRRLLCYDGVDPDGGELEVSSDKEQPPLPLLGSYRRLLLRPRRMSWELLQASSHETHRDSREMSGQLPSWQLPKGARREAVEGQRMEAAATVGMLDASAEGEATCDVAVQFDLPPGAYATMALREVMKTQPPPARLRHIRFDP